MVWPCLRPHFPDWNSLNLEGQSFSIHPVQHRPPKSTCPLRDWLQTCAQPLDSPQADLLNFFHDKKKGLGKLQQFTHLKLAKPFWDDPLITTIPIPGFGRTTWGRYNLPRWVLPRWGNTHGHNPIESSRSRSLQWLLTKICIWFDIAICQIQSKSNVKSNHIQIKCLWSLHLRILIQFKEISWNND